MKKLFTPFVLLTAFVSQAQNRQVAITIDDVPNTTQYRQDHYRHSLLDVLDSLYIPFTVFVNEGKLTRTDSVKLNQRLLGQWVKHPQSTVGNHTASHSRYSAVGLQSFMNDVDQGEKQLRVLCSQYHKPLKYFRFPFNDRGRDSLAHARVDSALHQRLYTVAPFTVESSDWMYSTVYEYYLGRGMQQEARRLGQQYVEKTLALFRFFDSLALAEYGRPVKQVYLCHDNALNAAYLPQIVQGLQAQQYTVVDLDQALTDSAYTQPDVYYRQWGISWFYRWMSEEEKRVRWMKAEPELKEIEQLYEALGKDR